MIIENVTATHDVRIGARKAFRQAEEGEGAYAWVPDGVHLALTDGERAVLRICTVAEARQIAQLMTEAADALSDEGG